MPSAYSAAVTDGVFSCVNERMSDDLARVGPVYAYEFNDRDAPAPESMRTLPFPVGASHSLELRFIFEVGGAGPWIPRNRSCRTRCSTTGAGSSNGRRMPTGQPEWPALGADVAAQPWMSLQPDGSRVVTDFDDIHQCPFWASLLA